MKKINYRIEKYPWYKKYQGKCVTRWDIPDSIPIEYTIKVPNINCVVSLLTALHETGHIYDNEKYKIYPDTLEIILQKERNAWNFVKQCTKEKYHDLIDRYSAICIKTIKEGIPIESTTMYSTFLKICEEANK